MSETKKVRHLMRGVKVQLFVGDDSGRELDYDQLHSLSRLDAIIRECLRLYPPVVAFIAMACSQGTKVAGHEIPAGVSVLVPSWALVEKFLRRKKNFPIPHRRTHHPASYVPFGPGPRECLGRRFALLELNTTGFSVLSAQAVQDSLLTVLMDASERSD
ncbi:cytochrome P450 3A29-like [Amblyomma americanum]